MRSLLAVKFIKLTQTTQNHLIQPIVFSVSTKLLVRGPRT